MQTDTSVNLLLDIPEWLRNYADHADLKGFVIGISGGIDSAVVSTLCASTGLPTIAASLPIYSHKGKEQLNRATKHGEWLQDKFENVDFIEVDLSNIYIELNSAFADTYNEELAFINSKSRLRMIALYQISTSKQYLVVGTGNKIEDFGVGFFTKYGDGGVDISPLADLYKSEVYTIGKALGIDDSIINAEPTDGLWEDGRTDFDQLGLSYDDLEYVMKHLRNKNPEQLIGSDKVKYHTFRLFYEKNYHKMVRIPVFVRK